MILPFSRGGGFAPWLACEYLRGNIETVINNTASPHYHIKLALELYHIYSSDLRLAGMMMGCWRFWFLAGFSCSGVCPISSGDRRVKFLAKLGGSVKSAIEVRPWRLVMSLSRIQSGRFFLCELV